MIPERETIHELTYSLTAFIVVIVLALCTSLHPIASG
jgi:hypothetical protein